MEDTPKMWCDGTADDVDVDVDVDVDNDISLCPSTSTSVAIAGDVILQPQFI
jgi:hypothetical protein